MKPSRRGWMGVAMIAVALQIGCASTPDPWEPMNRKVFWFNEQVDQHAIEPVARGWDWLVPELVQTGLRNFFDNLEVPFVLANDVLQLKPRAAAHDLLRLITNTTFGVGGLFDVASRENVQKNNEDFGQTLGYWGVPAGPYWVLPILGPSTPRSATGMLVEAAPTFFLLNIPLYVNAPVRATELLNLRAYYLEEVEQNRAESFDYYVFLRNAYLQNLRKKVADEADLPVEEEEDLYYFEDEDFEE